MMEQSYACKCHGDAVLVAGHNNMVVTDRAASLCNELYTALVGTLDVVAEGEEGVRAQRHLGILGNPLLLLSHGQHLRLLGKNCCQAPSRSTSSCSSSEM